MAKFRDHRLRDWVLELDEDKVEKIRYRIDRHFLDDKHGDTCERLAHQLSPVWEVAKVLCIDQMDKLRMSAETFDRTVVRHCHFQLGVAVTQAIMEYQHG